MAKRSRKKAGVSVRKKTLPSALGGDVLRGAGLMLLVVAAYLPMWWAGYIWDDDLVLTNNPVVTHPGRFADIWTTAAADICPLTITTFWAEYRLWGTAPVPYHIVNVLLHGMSALVLWRLLRFLEMPGAWFGAALWALHPVEAESVAWITEMKNTQSGLFYLLAILFFAHHLRGDERTRVRDYVLTLLFAALAIASKSSTVVLPPVLCLCAWWMERRWQWRTLAKVAPIILLSIAASVLSIWKQYLEGADDPEVMRSWAERLATAGSTPWFYLAKLIWPHPLVMVYLPWQIDVGNWISYVPLAALFLVLGGLWLKRESWGRGWFFAFAYFLVALLPVAGLLNMKYFAYTPVADHFQYLAAMGPLALAGAGLTRLAEIAMPGKIVLQRALGGVFLLILGGTSFQKEFAYQDEMKLWKDVMKWNPECWVGYNNVGMIFVRAGNIDEGIPYFLKSLSYAPQFGLALNNMGTAMLEKGNVDSAIAYYERALEAHPNMEQVLTNLGIALARKGRLDESIEMFHRALKLDPTDEEVGLTLGEDYFHKGEVDKALEQLKRTSAYHPESSRAHNNYGATLFKVNRVEEAVVQFQAAVDLAPNYEDARNNLTMARAQLARKESGAVQK